MLDFIINPLAGGKKGKRMKKTLVLLENRLKERLIEYKFHFTERARHSTEIVASLIKNGATDIIVCGGDGSLHEVINGFSDFDRVNMGIIPCGTGNDFASALNLPLDPVKALDVILDGKTKYVDFMQMPTVRGLNVIGMGIDVEVLKKYESLKKKTKFGYTKCLINTLMNFEYTDFDAELDGANTTRYRSFLAAVANGHRFGGGLEICPVSNPCDNKLDFVAVWEMPRLKIVKAFLKLKQKKLLTLKETVHKECEKIVVTAPFPYTVNVDGELYENIPFEVTIVSNTLKVYHP